MDWNIKGMRAPAMHAMGGALVYHATPSTETAYSPECSSTPNDSSGGSDEAVDANAACAIAGKSRIQL